MSKVVVLTDVEIDFARLVKPEAINGQGEPKYSCVVVWDKANGDNRTKLANAIQEAIAKGAEKGLWKKDFKFSATDRGWPIHDGDTSDRPEWAGKYYINAKASESFPPRVIDMAKTDLVKADLADGGHRIHSGMVGAVSFELFPYSNSGNKGIGVSLRCVLKQGEGTNRSGGSANADEDFADILENAATVDDLLDDPSIPF